VALNAEKCSKKWDPLESEWLFVDRPGFAGDLNLLFVNGYLKMNNSQSPITNDKFFEPNANKDYLIY
jgi:hypothetical protein